MANAQTQDSLAAKKLYVKANAPFLAVGMLNAGVEYQVNKHWTLQSEVFISPWKSFMGKYALLCMLGFEGRYYFKESFKHFYVGANFSMAAYKLQKYDYWGDQLSTSTYLGQDYPSNWYYQTGFAFFGGATLGYQWQINDHWNIDLFLRGGHVEGFYNGYVKGLNIRYENDGRDWNRSGEWIPYGGGLMIAYKLR